MTNTDRLNSLRLTAQAWQDILGVTVLSHDPSVSAMMRQCLRELWAAIEAMAETKRTGQVIPLPRPLRSVTGAHDTTQDGHNGQAGP